MPKEKTSQHLGNSNCRVKNVQAGKVPQEEVHRCVEPWLRYHHGHNDTISQKTSQVEQQEGDEEKVLQTLDIGEAQKDELSDLCAVQHCQKNRKQKQNVKVSQCEKCCITILICCCTILIQANAGKNKTLYTYMQPNIKAEYKHKNLTQTKVTILQSSDFCLEQKQRRVKILQRLNIKIKTSICA